MEQNVTGTLLGGRYALIERVGSGGMGDVWRAHDERLDRDVAVKVLRGGEAHDLARFDVETKVQAALDHPSIVPVLDASHHEEEPYLVMGFVDGHPLHVELGRGAMDPERVRRIGGQVADALDHAHERGIVHRDVKPGNVMLTAADTAVLTDFGIAHVIDSSRITQNGMVLGSPAYIAPEQLTDAPVGPAADIYSLGLVLLEALTGARQYEGAPMEAAMARLSTPPSVPDDLPAPWPALLSDMLATEPGDRPSAAVVAGRLADVPTASALAAPAGAGATAVLPMAAAAAVADADVDATTAIPLEDHTTAFPAAAPAGVGAGPGAPHGPSDSDRRRNLAWWGAALVVLLVLFGGVLAASLGDDETPSSDTTPLPTAPAPTDPPVTAPPPTEAPPPPPPEDKDDDKDDDEEKDNEGNRGKGKPDD